MSETPSVKSDYAELSDADLVTASLGGHQDAFAVIVRRYQGLVTGMLYNRCRGDISLSEELAQQTFVNAWQSLATLREPHRISSWLCGIARNVQLNSIRRRRNQIGLDSAGEIASEAAGPSEAAITREQEELLWRSLEKIPDKYRVPMVLYYRQDQSVVEVAKALDENQSTIRKRLERGRAMLRDGVARSIQDTLRQSGPGVGFTAGVLAALPVFWGSKASAAVIGAGTVSTTSKLSSTLATLGAWLGPIAGIVGAIYGNWNNYAAAESDRERSHILNLLGIGSLMVLGLFAGMGSLLYLRSSLPPNVYWMLFVGLWLVYIFLIVSVARIGQRRQAQIRFGEGVNGGPPMPTYLATKRHFYGMIVANLTGCQLWILLLAALAGDVVSSVLIVLSAAAFLTWVVRYINFHGLESARVPMFAWAWYVIVVYALVLNFRLNTWLKEVVALQRSNGLLSATNLEPPLWGSNVFLVAVAVGLLMSVHFQSAAISQKDARPNISQ